MPALPPIAPPNLVIDRSNSPDMEVEVDIEESNSSVAIGVEVIVSGLPRNSTQSATLRLKELISNALQNPDGDLSRLSEDFFHVTPGDNRHPVDYAYVAMKSGISNVPRPDLLQVLMNALNTQTGITARWRDGSGPDKSRRLVFILDETEERTSMIQKSLERWFELNHFEVQYSFRNRPGGGPYRLNYDFISPESVEKIRTEPPMINHRIYTPATPRIIHPIYGLEIAVAGCRECQGVKQLFDNYLNNKYGQGSVVKSRMMMDGEVYTVVAKDFEITSRILSEPFQPFSSNQYLQRFVNITQPLFLYMLNTLGVPTNVSYLNQSNQSPTASADYRLLKAEMDEMRKQGVETVQLFHRMFEQQKKVVEDMRAQNEQIAGAFGTLTSMLGNGMQLSAMENRLTSLEGRKANLESMLVMISDPTKTSFLSNQLAEVNAQVQQQQETIAKARQEFNDFHHSFARSLPRSLTRSLDSVPPINASDSLSSNQPLSSHEDPREQNVEPSSQRRKTNAGNKRKPTQASSSSISQTQS